MALDPHTRIVVLTGYGSIATAVEAIKLATGAGQPLIGRLLRCDARSLQFHESRLVRDTNCLVCGAH